MRALELDLRQIRTLPVVEIHETTNLRETDRTHSIPAHWRSMQSTRPMSAPQPHGKTGKAGQNWVGLRALSSQNSNALPPFSQVGGFSISTYAAVSAWLFYSI